MFFKSFTPKVILWMQAIGIISSIGLFFYISTAHAFSFFFGWEFWFFLLFTWGALVKLSHGRLMVLAFYPIVLGFHAAILLGLFSFFDLLVLPFLAGFGLGNFSLIFFLIIVHLLGTQ